MEYLQLHTLLGLESPACLTLVSDNATGHHVAATPTRRVSRHKKRGNKKSFYKRGHTKRPAHISLSSTKPPTKISRWAEGISPASSNASPSRQGEVTKSEPCVPRRPLRRMSIELVLEPKKISIPTLPAKLLGSKQESDGSSTLCSSMPLRRPVRRPSMEQITPLDAATYRVFCLSEEIDRITQEIDDMFPENSESSPEMHAVNAKSA